MVKPPMETVTSRGGSVLARAISPWKLQKDGRAVIRPHPKFHSYFLSKKKKKVKSLLTSVFRNVSASLSPAPICNTSFEGAHHGCEHLHNNATLARVFVSSEGEIYTHSFHRKSISVNLTETTKRHEAARLGAYVHTCRSRGDRVHGADAFQSPQTWSPQKTLIVLPDGRLKTVIMSISWTFQRKIHPQNL